MDSLRQQQRRGRWIDPRSVDFTDGFNPLGKPGIVRANPWVAAQLSEDPLWVALRNAKNLESRCYVAPDPSDQVIAGGTDYNYALQIDPYTWIWGINARGNQGAGFSVQITDASTGANFFSQPISSANLLAGTTPGCMVFLSQPRYFVPPSYPIIRLVNNSAEPQTIRLQLFGAVELFF